ncbi:serine/threonine protein phosphatase [Luteimonas aestuarii]|uniref:Serine/threonine protein phosphatase n=1 Tax=Luteimonas aestuarii TaxID=453837 RepID=A0A4R5TXV2_9GAMM|nr:serine/threonine protein phosphatase [Luteimonas aestuarii]TDK26044.1 serine/threonine protein phosphatase [Luteimonas aestuarii]
MAKDKHVSRIHLKDGDAWVKQYGDDRRVVRLRAMDWVVRKLGIIALRPPPRHTGAEGREVEQRRLGELSRLGVHVPRVLGHGDDSLVLSDIGTTLAHRLRHGSREEARVLLVAAVAAIAQVHASGSYLGAPVARNLTVDHDGRIGFLDFEEDPGEVMPLLQAQARDWLVFTAGVARHAPFDEEELSAILAHALRQGPVELRDTLGRAVGRLSFLKTLTRALGERASGLGKAVGSLQRALWNSAGAVLLAILTADLLHDGDLEVLRALAQWVD